MVDNVSGLHDEQLADESMRDSVLKQLDAEINQIQNDERRNGITKWALIGGIASLVWLLLAEYENEQLSSTGIQYTLIVISLAVAAIKVVEVTINTSSRIISLKYRKSSDIPVLSRNITLLFLLWWFVIYAMLITGDPGIPAYQEFFAFSFCGVAITYSLAVFIGALLDVPFPLQIRLRWQIKIILLILAFLQIIPIVGYIDFLRTNQYGVATYRFAMIIFALFILLMYLLRIDRTSLMASFISTRRNLSLGKISTENAIDQVEILTKGLALPKAFQSRLAEIFSIIDKTYEEYEQYMDLYTEHQEFMDTNCDQEDKCEACLPLMESISARREHLHKLVKSLGSSQKSLRRRLLLLSQFNVPREDLEEVLGEVRKYFDKLSSLIEESKEPKESA